jgi:hypothetical protein
MNAAAAPARVNVQDGLERAGSLAVLSDQPAHIRGGGFDAEQGVFLSGDQFYLDLIGGVGQGTDDGQKHLVDLALTSIHHGGTSPIFAD